MSFIYFLLIIFQLNNVQCEFNQLNVLESIVEQIDKTNFKVSFDSFNLPSVKTKNWTNSEKIINGQPVLPASFPFMVSLGMFSPTSYQHRCGGTIVNRKYVVTAAHCVSDIGQSYNSTIFFQNNKQVLSIIAGTEIISEINFLDLFKNQNIYLVRRISIHPGYTGSINQNDIAVLAINSILNFSPLVFSVELPFTIDPSAIFGQTVTTTGWGFNELGILSSQLMSTTLSVLNGTPLQGLCEGFENDFYCVQDLSETRSNVCFGDSGGPLLKFEQNKWIYYGITSFVFVDQEGQCLNEAPSFFSMVPQLSNWLNDQISK